MKTSSNGVSEAGPSTLKVEKVLALGWYDGPTQGVLECSDGRCYRFDMVSREESDHRDLIESRLSPASPADFKRLVSLLEQYQPAKWPIWVPSWSFPDSHIEQ